MKNLKKFLLQILFFMKERKFFVSFIVSLISILLILFKLINLNIIVGISTIPTLDLLFNSLVLLSTIYCMLFLPSYPIFFIIFRKKDFNFLEKLSLAIVFNLSYYILLGYIGFSIINDITGYFIYFSMISTFFAIILYIILVEIKNGRQISFKSYKSSFPIDFIKRDFSLLTLIKKKIQLASFLLIIFLMLNGILNIVRFDSLYGTDAWLHISIIRMISEMNFLPLTEYYGCLGFHIFSSIIHFFSGIDVILIPKYFPFYTILLSALVFYNLLRRIFKNKNLALFGVFLLEFSFIGISVMMYQFWPASLAFIQGIFIFYLLYKRLLDFVKIKRPTKTIISKDIFFYYSIITIIFISATLTHSLTSVIFLILFMSTFFLYFIKDIKRGIDFIFLFLLLIIFIILNQSGVGTRQLWFLEQLTIYWKELTLLLILLALPLSFLIWRIKNSILFTSGRYKAAIIGQDLNYYKTNKDKFIIPIAFIIVVIISTIIFIGNTLIFNVSATILFVVIELFFLLIFGIGGIVLFQKKPKGKIFLIWFLNFALISAAVLIFELIFPSQFYFMRIFYISSPIFVIGCVAYVYKFIIIRKIERQKIKLFFIIFITFSLFSSYTHEFFTVDEVSLKEQELSTIKWFADNNDKKSVILTEFGFNNIFIYYDYPYNNNNYELQSNEIHYFLKHDLNLFPPENHINKTGNNILQELKMQYKSDVYITLDNQYYLYLEWEVYGWLTIEQMEKYYSLTYINKIFSSKSELGKENPLYWVI